MGTFTINYMYIPVGEFESTRRGLPTKHGHGLLSSQLIRQPTAPTSAHTTPDIESHFFFVFARKKMTPPVF